MFIWEIPQFTPISSHQGTRFYKQLKTYKNFTDIKNLTKITNEVLNSWRVKLWIGVEFNIISFFFFISVQVEMCQLMMGSSLPCILKTLAYLHVFTVLCIIHRSMIKVDHSGLVLVECEKKFLQKCYRYSDRIAQDSGNGYRFVGFVSSFYNQRRKNEVTTVRSFFRIFIRIRFEFFNANFPFHLVKSSFKSFL